MRYFLMFFLLFFIAACANPHAVLVNQDGNELVCQAESFGISGSIHANMAFDKCVEEAQSKGYKLKK